MKKFLALLLAAMMALSCTAFAAAEEVDADLLAAAKAEGELIVYGSAEEPTCPPPASILKSCTASR